MSFSDAYVWCAVTSGWVDIRRAVLINDILSGGAIIRSSLSYVCACVRRGERDRFVFPIKARNFNRTIPHQRKQFIMRAPVTTHSAEISIMKLEHMRDV